MPAKSPPHRGEDMRIIILHFTSAPYIYNLIHAVFSVEVFVHGMMHKSISFDTINIKIIASNPTMVIHTKLVGL